MNPLVLVPAKLELILDAAKASSALVVELNSASVPETTQVRQSTFTLVIERSLQSRPSSHWGINE